MHEWNELTRLTRGEPIEVERVRLKASGIAIEGRFTLPALAELTHEEQIFIIAFVKCHGSIKEMERLFGISYPTVKNRLNQIGAKLEFVETDPTPSPRDVIAQLDKGELTVQEALEALSKS